MTRANVKIDMTSLSRQITLHHCKRKRSTSDDLRLQLTSFGGESSMREFGDFPFSEARESV